MNSVTAFVVITMVIWSKSADMADGFVKPHSPTHSHVSLVLTSVLLDQNQWPAWMCNEPEVNTKNENKHSPKALWSDLIENDKELGKAVLQWFGKPVVMDKNDQPGSMKPDQSASMVSTPRLTAEAKEKWRAPTPGESVRELPAEINALDPVSV
ncbi:hypothetical protein F5J12DRAFT_778525 [Pisolithus orientalis]|uniref:uncharacterized protein n=1 Tax=Pisolithus orientalis TaxID=936130 RepID=UPI00222581E1|nr:uncharacterized protein F5J12DRAFT_778525 [Pisolithus orientalis]KAI6034898.1 hypothetical protein F5J12DRAFT_778525 [Pisolithus orientalis]